MSENSNTTDTTEELPAGNEPVVENEMTESETTTEDAGEFEVDGQTFKTQAEAFEFARQQITQRDIELASAQSYGQAYRDASQRMQTPVQHQAPVVDREQQVAAFYEDPIAVLEKVRQETAETVKREMRQEIGASEADRQVWNAFTAAHPDLADFRLDVEAVVTQNAEVIKTLRATKGEKATYDFVARKTREKFDAYLAARIPKKELARTNPNVTPGTQNSVTQTTKKDEKVDFSVQLRQYRNSRLG